MGTGERHWQFNPGNSLVLIPVGKSLGSLRFVPLLGVKLVERPMSSHIDLAHRVSTVSIIARSRLPLFSGKLTDSALVTVRQSVYDLSWAFLGHATQQHDRKARR